MEIVSPWLQNLYDLYIDELQQLARDGDGQPSPRFFENSIGERRAQAHEYLKLMKTNPEFAAPLFHSGFGFQKETVPNKVLTDLVQYAPSRLPALADILMEVTIVAPAITQAMNMACGMQGGEEFLGIVIGLEYLRFLNRTAHSLDCRAGEDTSSDWDDSSDASYNDGEDEWKEGEAPDLLLDPLGEEN